MKDFYFIIDSRESRLLQVYGDKSNDKKGYTPKPQYANHVKFGQLDCGDILFVHHNDPVVLIERKEIKDLCCCIDSGSYKEQKMRMKKYQSENPGLKLIYLVENYSIEHKSDLDKIANPRAPARQRKSLQVLLSAIVSTMLRDDFYVMTTQGFDGTVAFIERTYDKWPSYKLQIENKKADPQLHYLKHIKVSKKDNQTPDTWYLQSLSNVPGVSLKKAKYIQGKYSTFRELIEAFESMENPEILLKDVQCGSRKLGKVVSKRIYQFVMNKI